jgi:hypothetical protein
MRFATRETKTFSLDRKILGEVKRTKGTLSESERVNRLLRRALDLERRAALDAEAASSSVPLTTIGRSAAPSSPQPSHPGPATDAAQTILRSTGMGPQARRGVSFRARQGAA